MGKINFTILNFTISPPCYNYQDHGYVNSIKDKTQEIDIGMVVSKHNDKTQWGRMYAKGYQLHIYYLQFSSHVENVRVRAHEETHALEIIGGLYLLSDALEKQNVYIDVQFIKRKEVIAELGAIYAIYERKLNPLDIPNKFITDNFKKALELYNNSKK